MEETDYRVKIWKDMNQYDKLEHETRAWSVCEAAQFLGYNPKYVYELIRDNKIEGWFEVNGSYRFCPAKLKAWLEKKFREGGHPEGGSNGSSGTNGSNGSSDGAPGREDEVA